MNDAKANTAGKGRTIKDVFELAIRAERKSMEFYKMLAEGFSHVPGLSAYWNGLMDDEAQHAESLERILESLTTEQLTRPADGLLLQKVSAVQKTLEGIQDIHTLEDAYETAHEIEYSEVNALFVLLAQRFVVGEDRKKIYLATIRDHTAKLNDFSQLFGDSEWRKSIKITDTEVAPQP